MKRIVPAKKAQPVLTRVLMPPVSRWMFVACVRGSVMA
jgi:hypothetical protein